MRSLGDFGVPIFKRYFGEAHNIRLQFAIFLSFKFESNGEPIKNAISNSSAKILTLRSDSRILISVSGNFSTKPGTNGAIIRLPKPRGAVTLITPRGVSENWDIAFSAKSIDARTFLASL